MAEQLAELNKGDQNHFDSTYTDITYTANVSANSVTAIKNGKALGIKVFDAVPTQTLGTSVTYATIGVLPADMRPTFDLLKLILISTISIQIRVDTGGNVKIGYATSLVSGAPYDITTSDHLFINETFLL